VELIVILGDANESTKRNEKYTRYNCSRNEIECNRKKRIFDVYFVEKTLNIWRAIV